MNSNFRFIAVLELILIFPAVLFMAALTARMLSPIQFEPAHTGQIIVGWYAGKAWTLWGLLTALPLAALLTGGISLLWDWNRRNILKNERRLPNPVQVSPAMILIAVETIAAGVILVIVGVHVLMN